MTEIFDIAGYVRISVDDELDRDNISIENQKAIIQDFVKTRFPGSSLTFHEDRDRSGYTFEQREGYQEMRRGLMSHKYDILIVKDFSRFSRRNSRGLVELEDLRDAGVRIISIGDGIDFPNDDDWLKIQFQFLINEMPVTDTSKKVRNVIKRRQADGEWLCAAPYGYIINKRKEFEIVSTEADIVRKIFDLYNNDGWGYKRIANYLTDQGVPTPRMSEQMRKEADGQEYKRQVKAAWAIVTVQGILDNDFYIGTLRQGKYTRAKINGKDIKRDDGEHIVIENHHQPIIDYRTFATTMALREKRTRSNYRGVKINDNVYSGFLECGDCGSPMFSMSRSDLKPAYTCGTYHRRGRKGCTSHHIRVDRLDDLLKSYVQKLMENSAAMIEQLNRDLARENDDIAETEQSADHLAEVLDELMEEMKVTKRQRIREIMKKPEKEAEIEATYDELEEELQKKIDGLNHQIDLLSDKRNTVIKVNRAAKTALEVFADILAKEKLDRNDLELIIDRVLVFEDHLEIKLQRDIDALLRCGTLEEAANFNSGIENSLHCRLVQSADKRPDKVFDVNVISDGDPLEIYTNKDGEVIFKKYSPIGELSEFAVQICDSLHKTTGGIAAVCDRDSIIAVAGGGKRELLDKRISPELETLMETRGLYSAEGGVCTVPAADGDDRFCVAVAAPILAEGDVMGCVTFLTPKDGAPAGETEEKLAMAVSGFLGKQMES
ncbi:MAG: recombinase family protein [Clostridiales bacterium]|nr:recombinase family protein [Clostridiales bacterium]MDD6936739.1 stage V sporulation T C-terminal domain-containing protein [Clostridiales bacterium]MDY2960798.1 stage V sporulation T C-terminal domain-containing protein [Oscillospiraceae bacterium]